jgi:hypothetical protein
MRRAFALVPFVLAALCWVAAGPGDVTLRALMACRPDAMHMGHHDARPPDGPCFCGQMTGGWDLAVSPAVPAPLAAPAAIPAPAAEPNVPSRFPLPSSPAFPPVSPPPNGLA